MDYLTETVVDSTAQQDDFIEERINKLTKELESSTHQDHRDFSTLKTTPFALSSNPPDVMNFDERTLPWIQAMSKLTEEQGEQLTILTEQARRLVAENEELRRRNIVMSRSKQQKSNDLSFLQSEATTDPSIMEGKQQLPQDPAMLNQENACLTEQLLLTEKEVEHQRDLLENRQQTIEALNEKLLNFSSRHDKLQSQMRQVQQDKSICEEQLVITTSRAQFNEESFQQIQIELDGERLRSIDLEARSKDLSCEKEALLAEAEQLSTKLSATVTSLFETKHTLGVTLSEVDSLKEQLRSKNKYISSIEVESMQRETLAAALKIQIQTIQGEEANIINLYELARKELQESELEADKLKSINAILKEKLQRLQNEHKIVIQTKWKELGKIVEDLKQHHEGEMKSHDAERRKLNTENANIRYELESLGNEKTGIQDKYNQTWRTLKEQKEHSQTHFKEFLIRITDAEERWEQEKATRLNTEHQLKTVNNELTICKELQLVLQNRCHERQKVMEADLKSLRSRNHELQQLVKQATTKNANLCEALEQGRKDSQEKIDAAMIECNLSIDALKLELHEGKVQANREMIKLQEECRKKQQTIEALQKDSRNTLDCIDRKLRDEREISKRLRKSNEELATRMNSLVANSSFSKLSLGEAKDKIDLLEFELEHTNFKLATIGRQLSKKIQDRQDRVSRIGNRL